jgi:positive regulator of sigma E activity
MDTNSLLQILASVLFTVGVLAFAASYTSFDALGLTTDDAFAAGVIFTSVGFVMLADLRRRARDHTKTA